MIGPASFIGAWITGAIITDVDYSSVDDPISRLAAVGAPTRPLMTAGFIGFGVGVSAFAVALRRRIPGPAWIAAATAAGSTVLVAAAPLDRSESIDGLHGLFAGSGYVALAATPLLAAPHLLRGGRGGLGLAGIGAGIVSASALVISLAGPPTGFFQRLGLTIDRCVDRRSSDQHAHRPPLALRHTRGLVWGSRALGTTRAMTASPVPTDAELVASARANIARAYSPYSKFKTGAVVVTDTGDIVSGTIVENVSLGLAMCAERVALFNAITQGATPVLLALAAPDTDGSATWPCGACLQVALELGGPDLAVVIGDDDDGPAHRAVLSDLLPRGPRVDR